MAIFKMLIEAKADINVKTNNIHSLDWAKHNQSTEMIDYINNNNNNNNNIRDF